MTEISNQPQLEILETSPETCFVDQVGPELRDPPASAYPVLGLKVCTITTQLTLGPLEERECS